MGELEAQAGTGGDFRAHTGFHPEPPQRSVGGSAYLKPPPGSVAQRLESRTVDPVVAGSNPVTVAKEDGVLQMCEFYDREQRKYVDLLPEVSWREYAEHCCDHDPLPVHEEHDIHPRVTPYEGPRDLDLPGRIPRGVHSILIDA